MEEKTKLFTYKARVERVIDGDTCDILADLGFNVLIKLRVRLYGIDAPETRTRDREEKARGLVAKERLRELIEGKEIKLRSMEWEKYGRCLALIWHVTDDTDMPSLSDILVSEGHAIYRKY